VIPRKKEHRNVVSKARNALLKIDFLPLKNRLAVRDVRFAIRVMVCQVADDGAKPWTGFQGVNGIYALMEDADILVPVFAVARNSQLGVRYDDEQERRSAVPLVLGNILNNIQMRPLHHIANRLRKVPENNSFAGRSLRAQCPALASLNERLERGVPET
jgi:hypothetical protein